MQISKSKVWYGMQLLNYDSHCTSAWIAGSLEDVATGQAIDRETFIKT